ncbi:MAG TPA: choice-of-anchor tandem repeat GloVer-containing protein [Verrucomicrobiae bacterium]
MKTKLTLLLAVFVTLALTATALRAQTFTVLHAFTTATDGSEPFLGPALSGETFYGSCDSGGTNNLGTVFSIGAGGSNFTLLHTFSEFTNDTVGGQRGTNYDGAYPHFGVVLMDGVLYGTAYFGGTNGWGDVFSLDTNGSNFNAIYTFPPFGHNPGGDTNGTGTSPGGLVFSDGILYGVASSGGTNDGTLFSLDPDGTDFNVLHTFSTTRIGTNVDGAHPFAAMTRAGGTFYGTAELGGIDEYGVIYSIGTNGSNFTVVYTFTGSNDGWNPMGGMAISGGTLYGISEGGIPGWGNVFSVSTNGSNFTVLHAFSSAGELTNYDGANPQGNLLLLGDTLYGTTENGGQSYGTVYSVKTNGSDFTVLYTFTNGLDGSDPITGLLSIGNNLYGTTFQGGANGGGTLYRITLPPQSPVITGISFAGSNLSISASNALSGQRYMLLTSINLALPSSAWAPVSTNASDTSGNLAITLTNAVKSTTASQFYILRSQ